MKAEHPIHISLLVRICVVIVVISLAVAGLVSWLNYNSYLEAVLELDTSEIENIGDTIKESVATSEWRVMAEETNAYTYDLDETRIEAIRNSDAFNTAYNRLQQITDSFGLENAFVFSLDEDFMGEINEGNFTSEDSCIVTFIMDCYATGSDKATCEPGEVDSWWVDYDGYLTYCGIFDEAIASRECYTVYETLDDGSRLLTGYYPVFDEDDCVAFVCVSRSVGELKSYISSFFISSLIAGTGIALALCVLAVLLFYLSIVRPLRLIKREAEQFTENSTRVSDKLSGIHTHDEIQALAGSFLKMERDLNEYIGKVERVTAEKEHISTELSVAAHIQEDMLPRIFPPYPDRKEFSIFASMDPAKEVGGDFYDFFFIDKDHLALVVADVSGKGVPASLFMVISKTLIKTRTLAGGRPAEILRDVNAQLCEGNDAEMFVTVWLGILDVNTGKGIAANAGHEHPALCRKGGEYELVVNRHSPAVATLEGIKFREHEFELQPGDRLFIYSDGLPEATNEDEEMYGTDRMLNALNACKAALLSEQLPAVTQDVAQFVGDAPQFDDLTMLAFEYNGPAE